MATGKADLAVWAITANGMAIARRLTGLEPADLKVSVRLEGIPPETRTFERLAEAVKKDFGRYQRHVFIMSTGIVVRMIAGLLDHKTVDPAVVAVDDRGRFAVSLVSGHIGGANRLAEAVAAAIGATPVITTATDVNRVPAMDVIATDHGLAIENPAAIKHVNMALLENRPLWVHDPYGFLDTALDVSQRSADIDCPSPGAAGVFVDDRRQDLADTVLVLRPPVLVAGIGCNRGTEQAEISELLYRVLDREGLSPASLTAIASVDIKSDEAGLIGLARTLNLPLTFFTRDQLNQVRHVPTPSAVVAKHIGVSSVCEAAAILAAPKGRLIVSKQTTANVTVAIARTTCISSASDRAT